MKGTSLFAAIVAILVAFTVYDYISGQKKDAAKADAERVVHLDKASLKVIEVDGKNGFRLEKVNGHWNITKPYAESADQQVVMTYIEQLFGEKTVATVAENPDPAKYGLSTPLFTLHLVSTGDERVKLGSVKAYDNSLYAQVEGSPKVLLVSSAWDVMLSKLPTEFRDTKLYRGPMKKDFNSISLASKDVNFELKHEGDKYVQGAEKISQQRVQMWLEQVKALRGAAYIDDPAFKPDTTIKLDDFVLKIAHDKAHPQQFEATSTDLSGGLKSVVIVSSRALETILVKDFLDPKAPFAFDPSQVASVKFIDHGKTIDTKVDPKKPDSLIAKISQLEAIRFLGAASKEKKFPSHLTLLKSDGSVVFEMSWGEPITEKNDGVDATYLPVKTSLSKQLVGVPEKQIALIGAQPEEGP